MFSYYLLQTAGNWNLHVCMQVLSISSSILAIGGLMCSTHSREESTIQLYTVCCLEAHKSLIKFLELC